MALTAWSEERARELIAAHVGREGAALPILHALRDYFGYVPEAAVPLIADALNITRAEMHGIVTFYHDFRRVPPGRHVLKLCRAEACQARGGADLAEHVLKHLGIAWHETTRDGAVSLEPVYCLGFCSHGPSALFDEQPHARLNAAKLDALLKAAS